MQITTKAFDQLRPYVEKAMYDVQSYTPMGGDVYGDFAGTIQSAIKNYLEDMQAADLRAQREMNPWANAAIMNRRDQVADAEMRIVTRNGEEMSEQEQELASMIMDVLERPDPLWDGESWGVVKGPAIDDALTINKGVAQKLLWDDRSTRGLKVLDGNRVKVNPKFQPAPDGSLPPEVPRWLYKDKAAPPEAKPIEFMDDEIIVFAPYSLSYDDQGLAPMRALKRILQAELDVFTWMHRTQQQGSPGGIFMLPGAAPGTPDRAKQIYELKLAGKAGLAFMNLPKDSKYIELGSMNQVASGTFTFYEILMKATAISFRTTPFHLGWEPKASLSTTTDAQMEFTDDGILSLLRFLRGIENRRIIASFGDAANNLYLTYGVLEAEEEMLSGAELRAIAGPIGFASVNDIKVMRGMKPYTRELLQEIFEGDQDLVDGVWPYVSQEYVPALAGNAVINLPLQYAFQQNKSSMDQQAAQQQQQQAQQALTSAIAGHVSPNGHDPIKPEEGGGPVDAPLGGAKTIASMTADAQRLLMLRKALVLSKGDDDEFQKLIEDLADINGIFERKVQRGMALPSHAEPDEGPVKFSDE